jgi:hypothetical protein
MSSPILAPDGMESADFEASFPSARFVPSNPNNPQT